MNRPRHDHAFTLIELILVMTLLVVIVSLVMPSLEKFFGGRTLDSEVRRFVALTHYGQSRAVSEGVPMLLWVNPKAGTYGLEQEPGYNDSDPKAVDYVVGTGVSLNVPANGIKPTNATKAGKSIGIHFSPDGNIITATSVGGVIFQEGRTAPVLIAPSHNGLSYEAQTQSANARR
jgi:prepilin-type N-terminal cleavage/methylation domain-containing protein